MRTVVIWGALALVLVVKTLAGDSGRARWDVPDLSPDGTNDCTAALQVALERAGKAGGGIVELPAGRFRCNGTLSIPANVTLQGIFRSAPNPGGTTAPVGTVLLAYAGRGKPEAAPFVRLGGN